MTTRIEPSADVDARAEIGDDTLVWHLAQIREHARIGRECVIGRGAYVGPGVVALPNASSAFAVSRSVSTPSSMRSRFVESEIAAMAPGVPVAWNFTTPLTPVTLAVT